MHWNLFALQCPLCPFKSHVKEYLKNHIKKIHEKWRLPKFHCIFCKKICTYKANFEDHLRSHTQERPFTCKLCPREFSSRASKSVHVKRVHCPNRPLRFKCHFCPKRCYDKGDLAHHLRTHTGEKAYKCNDCGKDFGTNAGLKRHFITIHTSDRPYECKVCSRRFKLPGNFNAHKKIHDQNGGQLPFPCTVCNVRFRTRILLENHLLTHQVPGTGRGHKCRKCGKAFSSQKSLKMHHNIHFGEKRFRCEVCDKKFLARGTLKLHLSTHNKQKVFNCQACSFSTHSKQNLGRHFGTMHEGRVGYRRECIFCKKRVKSLNDHFRIHTREKPHFCRFCTEEFALVGNRRSHEKRLHNPDRKREVECPLCPKLFFDNNAVKTHLLIHTGEKAYKCENCGKDFATRVELRRHFGRIHSVNRPL